jgi:hypothetical protein
MIGDHENDWPSRKGVVWASVIAFLLVVVLPLGLWAGGVILAPVAGKAQAYKDKHSSANWTQAQAGFETLFADAQKFDQQIGDAQAALDTFKAENPEWKDAGPYDALTEDLRNKETVLTGLTQQCKNTVADYNSRARTYTLRDFKSGDLPQQLGQDEGTDCLAVPQPTNS